MSVLPANDDEALTRATAALDAGELVVVPGDLCYLVAADALDDEAIERLFLVTGRAADRPLTVILGGYEDLHHIAFGGSEARALAERAWPGAATLVLRARPWAPDALRAGRDEVAVSVPAQPYTRALASRFGPIAVASARRDGGQAPRSVAEVRAALGAEVALLVDGGALPGGEAKVIRGGGPAPE